MTSQKRFLAVNDVAEILSVTVRQVRALLHSGELRGIQVGGRGIWRIEASELEDYIARQYDRAATAIADDQFTAESPKASQH